MISHSNTPFPAFPDFKFLKLVLPSNGVCHLQLDRKPVNALDTALWTELVCALDHVENHLFPGDVRVMVISSNCSANVFSAGNDLTELYVPMTTQARFFKFWRVSTLFLSRLYKSPVYTISAMRGATPAGGFVMSLCCDYRVASQNAMMGLNEVAIGLSVPRYWARLMLLLVTTRSKGEQLLASGEMVPAKEAHKLGLVDETFESGNAVELHRYVLDIAQTWAKQKDVYGRVDTKLSTRQTFADDWEAYTQQEAENAWKQLSSPQTISILGGIMEKLSKRREAKI